MNPLDVDRHVVQLSESKFNALEDKYLIKRNFDFLHTSRFCLDYGKKNRNGFNRTRQKILEVLLVGVICCYRQDCAAKKNQTSTMLQKYYGLKSSQIDYNFFLAHID